MKGVVPCLLITGKKNFLASRRPFFAAYFALNPPLFLSQKGAQPRLRFDPPFLKLGPVLPHMTEGHSLEVEVINESPWDVEIFSLDFDQVKRPRSALGVQWAVFCLYRTSRTHPTRGQMKNSRVERLTHSGRLVKMRSF